MFQSSPPARTTCFKSKTPHCVFGLLKQQRPKWAHDRHHRGVAVVWLDEMRSVLTALGIIIGVGAVIAMVGIGNGAKAQVESQIASLGENVILIFSGSTTSSGIRTGWGGAGTLKIEDAEAIRREVPGVIAVSEGVVSTKQVEAGNQNWFTRIYGESADYFDIRQWPLDDGAPFTAQDVRAANKVCVIGRTTATQIYGNDDPVGPILRIKNVPL